VNTKEELESLPLARMHTSTSFSVGGGGVLVLFFGLRAGISMTAAVDVVPANQVRGCHEVSYCHCRERRERRCLDTDHFRCRYPHGEP